MAPPDKPPSRQEVDAKLCDLLSGKASREEVADWAAHCVRMANPEVKDPCVWKALTQLAGADLGTTDRPYLHNREDFAAWLADFRG